MTVFSALNNGTFPLMFNNQIEAKQTAIKDAKKDVKAAKSDVKNLKTEKARG